MNLFRRALRFFFLVTGFVAGLIVAIAALFVRLLTNPPRQRLWSTPADVGLPYEEITFPARDGLRLAGWFIPAQDADGAPRPTVMLVHAWLWNRLGDAAESPLAILGNARVVNLLRPAHALHQAGYHVCLFDLRGHGESAGAGPVTFGLREAEDVLGAAGYLAGRPDVDAGRLGAVGFASGANSILYALAQAAPLQAAVLVQPLSAARYSARYAHALFGPLGGPILLLAETVYKALGGTPFHAVEPGVAAARAQAPLLYIQGMGDPWGSVDDVAGMAGAAPTAVAPLYPATTDRYGGYLHAVNHPNILTDFFARTLV